MTKLSLQYRVYIIIETEIPEDININNNDLIMNRVNDIMEPKVNEILANIPEFSEAWVAELFSVEDTNTEKMYLEY